MQFTFARNLDHIGADRVNSTMEASLKDKSVLKGRTILLVSSQDGSSSASAAPVGALQCIKPLCACAASCERRECRSISGISPFSCVTVQLQRVVLFSGSCSDNQTVETFWNL